MRFVRHRLWLTALVAVAVGLAAGGIAWADIPDTGVIQGCYKPNNGSLRVIDADRGGKCSNGESAINWNQTGPTGTKGAPGPTGPTGATGPSGPSDAYTNYGSWGLISEGDTATVASVTLPSGNYTLSAAVGAYAATDEGTLVECQFVSAGTVNGLTAIASTQGSGIDNADEQQMPVVGDVTITSDNTSVFLRCRSDVSDANVRAGMIATRVGAITPSE